ncbi:MAG: helix-turn-helix transcriptional regulator [Bacteroidota bacterium]
MKKQHIGELEELVLLIIILLGEEAYGLAIRKALQEHAHRTITIGAVHGTVNRLEKKGLLTSHMGGATDSRGGRRKRLFTLTTTGKKSLKNSRDLKVNLWMQIPELSLNLGS